MIYGLQRYKSAMIRGGQVPLDTMLRKEYVSKIEDVDARRVAFIISTATIDRAGDRVMQDGWQLEAFKANPVVLWAHNSSAPPIGRSVEIGVVNGVLRSVVEFVPASNPAIGSFADGILQLCQGGFVSATSVGFRPLEATMAKDRMQDDDWFPPFDFLKSELMEFSICSIPCNPETLIEPDGAGNGAAPPPPAAAPLDVAAAAAAAVTRAAEEEAAAEVLASAASALARIQRRRRARLVLAP